MKENVLKVMEWVHMSGLEANLWNIELEGNSSWFYDIPGHEGDELSRHIALFEMSGAPDEILDLCDDMYWSETFGKVYFYWL